MNRIVEWALKLTQNGPVERDASELARYFGCPVKKAGRHGWRLVRALWAAEEALAKVGVAVDIHAYSYADRFAGWLVRLYRREQKPEPLLSWRYSAPLPRQLFGLD